MPKYTPTIEEVKEAIDNARKILEGYFPSCIRSRCG